MKEQFSHAFDILFMVRDDVEHLVHKQRGRSEIPNWHLKHACSACLNLLQDEPKQEYDVFVTMDGGNSLKRVEAKKRDGDGQWVNIERPDARTIHTQFYISEAEVNEMKDQVKRPPTVSFTFGRGCSSNLLHSAPLHRPHLHLHLTTRMRQFVMVAQSMLQNQTLALNDGSTWVPTTRRRCGRFLTRQVSSSPFVGMGSCY